MFRIRIPGIKINLGLFSITISGKRIEREIEEQIDLIPNERIAELLRQRFNFPILQGLEAASLIKRFLKEIIVGE